MNEGDNKIKICQSYLLKLLKYFHSLCEKHNIKYTLEAGTLIGAVRDKGFIPWDDDADVSLVRDEYDKLITALKTENLPPEIGIYYPEEKKEFLDFNLRFYLKDIDIRDDEYSVNQYDGVFMHPTLDVFIFDYIPSMPIAKRLFVLRLQIIFGLAMSKRHDIKYNKYSTIEKIAIYFLSKIGKLFSIKTLCQLYEKAAKRYLKNKTDYLYCTGWDPKFPGWIYHRNIYEKVHLTEYEDTKLYIIDEYDKALEIGYGDWKTPAKTHDHSNHIKNL